MITVFGWWIVACAVLAIFWGFVHRTVRTNCPEDEFGE